MAESSAMTRIASRERRREHGTKRSTADFLFDAFFGGGVGGSVLALFMMIVDIAHERALFTPSLLGTVLLTDTPASATTPIRIDMVAYFSVFHFLAFLLAGVALSGLYNRVGAIRVRPLLVGGAAFAGLTAGFALWSMAMMPGVIEIIGLPWIVAGNLLASVLMVLFLEWAHRQSEVPRVV